MFDSVNFVFFSFPFANVDVLREIITREEEAGITPDPDIDTFMKVQNKV